jgi:uncharacterized membrane-anchored protein
MNILPALISMLLAVPGQSPDSGRVMAEDSLQAAMESTLDGLKWQSGKVSLMGGKMELALPEGYRYLDSGETRKVIVDLWGNPSFAADNQMGMVFAPGQEPVGADSWSVVVSYDDQGHVDDKDAASINYDELLTALQKSTEESNLERQATGGRSLKLVGWAERPTYDATAKTLFWAKEFEQGDGERRLNYGVRILGREGILSLSAVSRIGKLKEVKLGMNDLFSFARFTPGNTYADFKSGDRISQAGLSVLVAGGAQVAAKSGLFKIVIGGIVAGKQFALLGFLLVLALLFFVYRRFFGKSDEGRFGTDMADSPRPE